jgi:phospholipid-transporting ATPase
MFNVFFTVLPPFSIGVFDQFISARLLDRYPQLYMLGQKSEFFNTKVFWLWILNGFYQSAIAYVASAYFFVNDGIESNGQVSGHWVWGTTLYTAVLVTVLGKAALITNTWTKWTIVAIPGSFVIWMVFLPIYAIVAPAIGFSTEFLGIVPHLFPNLLFWATIVIIPFMCLIRDFAWK